VLPGADVKVFLNATAEERARIRQDPVVRQALDLFDLVTANLLRAADHVQGAWSILTGVAANRSMETGRPVRADRRAASTMRTYARPSRSLGLTAPPPSMASDSLS
jgi:hypothetical protein